MLKIKDNVDLKELEKFGFEDTGLEYEWSDDDGWLYDTIRVAKDYKDIKFIIYDDFEGMLNILFDLIQAGLVEKVEEFEND